VNFWNLSTTSVWSGVRPDSRPAITHGSNGNSIPTLKVFRDGTVTDQLVGLANKQQLRKLLKL
jgi:thioredoxin-like negative regulator of GroEL